MHSIPHKHRMVNLWNKCTGKNKTFFSSLRDLLETFNSMYKMCWIKSAQFDNRNKVTSVHQFKKLQILLVFELYSCFHFPKEAIKKRYLFDDYTKYVNQICLKWRALFCHFLCIFAAPKQNPRKLNFICIKKTKQTIKFNYFFVLLAFRQSNVLFFTHEVAKSNRPLPKCFYPLLQSVAWCSAPSWKRISIHMEIKLISYERLCTRPRFDREAGDNSEMAYLTLISKFQNWFSCFF